MRSGGTFQLKVLATLITRTCTLHANEMCKTGNILNSRGNEYQYKNLIAPSNQ